MTTAVTVPGNIKGQAGKFRGQCPGSKSACVQREDMNSYLGKDIICLFSVQIYTVYKICLGGKNSSSDWVEKKSHSMTP